MVISILFFLSIPAGQAGSWLDYWIHTNISIYNQVAECRTRVELPSIDVCGQSTLGQRRITNGQKSMGRRKKTPYFADMSAKGGRLASCPPTLAKFFSCNAAVQSRKSAEKTAKKRSCLSNTR